MSHGGGGEGGGIVGDGPLIEEVEANVSLLPAGEQTQFAVVYAAYQADETSLTEAQILFVLDCGKQIVRALNR